MPEHWRARLAVLLESVQGKAHPRPVVVQALRDARGSQAGARERLEALTAEDASLVSARVALGAASSFRGNGRYRVL